MCAHQACMYRRLTPSSLQVISTEGAAPDRTAHAQESVAKLRAQLTELQQAEAALGQQVGWRLRGPPAGTGLTRGASSAVYGLMSGGHLHCSGAGLMGCQISLMAESGVLIISAAAGSATQLTWMQHGTGIVVSWP